MFFRYRGYNRLLVDDPYETIEDMYNRDLLEVNDDAILDRPDVRS